MASRKTLNVSLTPALGRFVESRVRSGKYQTASEVVRAALCLLQARDREPVATMDALRAEIELGLGQLRRGEAIDGDEFFRQLRERRAGGD